MNQPAELITINGSRLAYRPTTSEDESFTRTVRTRAFQGSEMDGTAGGDSSPRPAELLIPSPYPSKSAIMVWGPQL